MRSNLPLAGKTIVLTGSKKTESVLTLIDDNGANAVVCPLIQIKELKTDADNERIKKCNTYDWLIFTSQNAVTAFHDKMKRARVLPFQIRCKIAVVGEKTAEAMRQIGFPIHFMPSVYSADYFVQEFKGEGKLLFLRGSLAKETITVGTGADEWTVYETIANEKYIDKLEETIVHSAEPIIVFASPSAVHIYAKRIVPRLDWRYAKYATIGHVTTEALQSYGVEPIVQPQTYTMQAVIKQIISEVSSK